MKKHNSWRIIAVTLVFIIFGLIFNGLIKNSQHSILEKYSAKYYADIAVMYIILCKPQISNFAPFNLSSKIILS